MIGASGYRDSGPSETKGKTRFVANPQRRRIGHKVRNLPRRRGDAEKAKSKPYLRRHGGRTEGTEKNFNFGNLSHPPFAKNAKDSWHGGDRWGTQRDSRLDIFA